MDLMPRAAPKISKPSVIINPFLISWKNVVIALLVGISVISAAVVGYYYLQLKGLAPPPPVSFPKTATPSAQKDETAGWKTYQNKGLEFTIKYPSDWEISEVVGVGLGLISFKKNKAEISIGVVDKARIKSFSCSPKGEIAKVLIGGLQTSKCAVKSPEGAIAVVTIQDFSKNGELWYEIDFIDPKPYEKNSEKVKIFDQMLSTFKFLD